MMETDAPNGDGGSASASREDGDGDEEYDDGMSGSRPRKPWLPPGADADEDSEVRFGDDSESHFRIPARLADKSSSLVMAVNDFHYAMVNDHPRNEFFQQALARVISPAAHVLEIGTGSGLLAMIAARLGARHVTAIEANVHMAALARKNIAANGLADRITVLNAMSTDVMPEQLAPHGPADVLVSEVSLQITPLAWSDKR
jgi:protein arginine N-methyltransferase 7